MSQTKEVCAWNLVRVCAWNLVRGAMKHTVRFICLFLSERKKKKLDVRQRGGEREILKKKLK